MMQKNVRIFVEKQRKYRGFFKTGLHTRRSVIIIATTLQKANVFCSVKDNV